MSNEAAVASSPTEPRCGDLLGFAPQALLVPETASLFAALATSQRLRIVNLPGKLPGGSAPAGEIASAIERAPSLPTAHLKTAAQAGLVESERLERNVRYRLRPEPFRHLAHDLKAAASALHAQPIAFSERRMDRA